MAIHELLLIRRKIRNKIDPDFQSMRSRSGVARRIQTHGDF